MRRSKPLVTGLVLLFAGGCRVDIDTPEAQRGCTVLTVPSCEDALGHADFDWLDAHVLKTTCASGSCHAAKSNDVRAAKLVFDGEPLVSWQSLFADAAGTPLKSQLEPSTKLVVPGHPEQSYLFFIMQGIPGEDFDPPVGKPPEDIGFMPKTTTDAVCCQKLDMIERWINAGAPQPTGAPASVD